MKQRREARSLLQQGRQKWEKTHIDANVSDDQKRAVYIRLMHEQQQEQSLRTAERQRQREEVCGHREMRILALVQKLRIMSMTRKMKILSLVRKIRILLMVRKVRILSKKRIM